MNRLCTLLTLMAGLASAAPVANVLALETTWQTETADEVTLRALERGPYVLAFIYTSCPSTCPLTTQKLKRLDAALVKAGKPLNIVVVSLDPLNDTPVAIANYRVKYGLKDAKRWRILVGNESQLRSLTMLLGFKYLKNAETGAVTHDNTLYLIGQNGDVLTSASTLDAPLKAFVDSVPTPPRK